VGLETGLFHALDHGLNFGRFGVCFHDYDHVILPSLAA
jgi:hypothetical protein